MSTPFCMCHNKKHTESWSRSCKSVITGIQSTNGLVFWYTKVARAAFNSCRGPL